MEAVVKTAKVPVIRFHDLRHTFASLPIQNGESLATAATSAGAVRYRSPWTSTGIILRPWIGWMRCQRHPTRGAVAWVRQLSATYPQLKV
jgi:hypothetical protein